MGDVDYPLASNPEEIARLRVQAESLAGETQFLLDQIALPRGAACLDLGCGAGGITDLLSAKVGDEGAVLGVDVNEFSLAAAEAWARQLQLTNVTYRLGDIFDHDLTRESFDLVHLRYVITTIGQSERVIRAALDLVKPGGVLIVQEADGAGIQAYPESPAFTRLQEVLLSLFEKIGADPTAGRSLYAGMRHAGLTDLNVRVCTATARAEDPLADYLPQTVHSVQETIEKLRLIEADELERLIGECRQHLANPETISTTSKVFQVWGRKPLS